VCVGGGGGMYNCAGYGGERWAGGGVSPIKSTATEPFSYMSHESCHVMPCYDPLCHGHPPMLGCSAMCVP
jgi:hypothetical protein